jgi:hypothetical protein
MTAAKPEQDLEGLRDDLRNHIWHIYPNDPNKTNQEQILDAVVRLVQAEVAAARRDELRKYDMQHTGGQRSHKEYVNDRMAELTPPQQPPTEGGSK